MKFILIVLISIALCSKLKAQDYSFASGVRVGVTSGVEYKRFITDEKASTLLLSFHGDGIQFTLLREFHQPILLNTTEQLFFFFGYGGHFGYSMLRNKTHEINGVDYRKEGFTALFGFDAVIGFEYHLIKYPLSINLDLKPFAELNIPWYVRKEFFDFGIHVSYTF